MHCEECGKRGFTSHAQIKRHKQRVHSERKWNCPVCRMNFSRNDNMKNHVRRKHAGFEANGKTQLTKSADSLVNWECPKCKRSDFTTKTQLDFHLNREHDTPTWTCKKCSRKYMRKKDLMKHVEKNHSTVLKANKTAELSTAPYCETNHLRNQVPYPEVEPYTITHLLRDETYTTTSTRFTDLILKFKGLSNHSFSDAMVILEKSLHNVMSLLCRRANAKDHDLVRWVFNTQQLRSPISISLVRVDQSSVSLLMEALDRVLQSYHSFNVDDTITVNFVYQLMPSPKVAGIEKTPLNHRSIIEIDDFIRSKSSIITPKVTGFLDDKCFALALFLEKYIIESGEQREGKRNKRIDRSKVINSMRYRGYVKNMLRLSKIQKIDGPYSIPHCISISRWFIDMFSKGQNTFSIHCYEVADDCRQVWMVGEPLARSHIHIMVHESHAYLCSNIQKFWGQKFNFCEPCGKQYHRKSNHNCSYQVRKNVCKLCGNPICSLQGLEELYPTGSTANQCFGCRKHFSYSQCLTAHQTNGHKCLGKDYKRCLDCKRVDRKKYFQEDISVHSEGFCETAYCKKCNERKPLGHEFCFVSPYKKNEVVTKHSDDPDSGKTIDTTRKDPKTPTLYFFDCESIVTGTEDSRHQFVLVILQRQNGTEEVFYGSDAVDQFMSYLFAEKVGEKRIVLAHNFRGYDSMPILEWAYSKGLSPDIIFNGQSCFGIKFPKLKLEFKCSFNFIKQPLCNFGKCFSLKENKGFFPHLFHTTETQHYVGRLPDMKFYFPETMTPTRYQDFLKWYDAEKEQVGENWNLKDTLISYCRKDVEILRAGCTLYAEMSEKICGLNPFITALTSASATMQAFRKDYLEKDTIVIIHDHGLQPETKFSRMGEQWIAWIAHKENIKIKSSLNGKEVRIGPYRLDGAISTSKPLKYLCPFMDFTDERERCFALEFMGCHVHGCAKCGNQEKKNPFTGEKLKYCIEKSEKKREYLAERGINMITKQSCEFQKEVSENAELNSIIGAMGGLALPLAPRDAFFGGRTNLTALYHERQAGEKIRYVDFNSLYPFICSFRHYPVGAPTVIRFGLENIDINNLFGLMKVTVLPPQELFLPVLPIKADGKLIFTLCRTCAEEKAETPTCTHDEMGRALFQETYTTEEIKLAIKHGYKILTIHEVWNWETKSDTLFREFLMSWYKIKLQSSPLPKTQSVEMFTEQAFKNYGIRIDPEEVIENPAMKTLAKDRLNSFWGKWGQRLNLEKSVIIKEYSELFSRLSDPNMDEPNIVGLGHNTLLLSWKQQNDHIEPLPNLSLLIAIFTASWARIHLYKEIFEVLRPEQILYFDTDSCVYIEKDDFPTLDTSSCQLGTLVDEIPEDQEALRYFSAGPKCWALEMKTKDGDRKEWISKSKGIKMTNRSLEDLPIEEMHKAVRNLDFSPKIVTDPHKIRRNIAKGHLFSKEEEKTWKINITKRVICDGGKWTLPFGYFLTNK